MNTDQYTELNTLALSKKDHSQVLKQLPGQQHTEIVDVRWSFNSIEDIQFCVFPKVLNPDTLETPVFVRYLVDHRKRLIENKNVLDLGAGCGVLGIVANACGSKHVTLTDISEESVANCYKNAKRFPNKISVLHSDLFSSIDKKFDLIIFHYPFFDGSRIPSDPILAAMIMPAHFFKSFLIEAVEYLVDDGLIVFPCLGDGGDIPSWLSELIQDTYEAEIRSLGEILIVGVPYNYFILELRSKV